MGHIRNNLNPDLKNIEEEDLNGHIVKLKTKKEELFAIVDSGSPMSFVNEKMAETLRQNGRSTIIKLVPPADTAQNLACYNGKNIVPEGRLSFAVESGEWTLQSVPFIIVHDQKSNIIGRNNLPKIGIKLVQEKIKTQPGTKSTRE